MKSIYLRNWDDTRIGVSMLNCRKKPCLCVIKGNTLTKYASFNDEEAAQEFMRILSEFTNKEMG